MTETEELEQLRAENARLRQVEKNPRAITLKVSEKGGVSLYGLGRFPVTLYREQWERLIVVLPDIQEFIAKNISKLKIKAEA